MKYPSNVYLRHYFNKIKNCNAILDNYVNKLSNSMHINYKTNKYIKIIFILIVFLIPSTINVHGYHNWGDDFAQYISQAINISKGVNQQESKLIQDEDTKSWGAPLYVPPGFPLILSFSYLLNGNNMLSFQILIALFYFFLCLLLFDYYQYSFKSCFIALLLTYIVFYNPWLLNFKRNIITDIPYTFFSFLSLYYIDRFYKNDIKFAFVTGVICGFAWTIRPAGVALVAAIFIYGTISILNSLIKNKDHRKEIVFYSSYFLIVVFSFIVYWFITDFIFKMSIDPKKLSYNFNYNDIVAFTYVVFFILAITFIYLMLRSRKSHYLFFPLIFFITVTFVLMGKYIIFLEKENIFLKFLNYQNYLDAIFLYLDSLALLNPLRDVYLLNLLLLSLIVYGFLIKIFRRIDVTDVFVITNIIMILYVKASNSGGFSNARYLLPILPFIVGYIFISIDNFWGINKSRLIMVPVGIFTIWIYTPFVFLIAGLAYHVDGPQAYESVECFEYINKNIKNDSVIIFFKPRALNLYTDNFSHSPVTFGNIKEAESKYDKLKTEYLLLYSSNEKYNLILKEFIDHSKRTSRVWNNNQFILYKYLR